MAMALLLPGTLHAAAAEAKVDPANATWHIGISELWGTSKRGGRNLDIYATFEKGKWVRALATARRFNTSIHFVEKADVRFEADTIKGKLKVRITPDRWVPRDGQPIDFQVEIDGKLKPVPGKVTQVTGTYKGLLQGKEVKGSLIGGVGATETGFENSAWSFSLNVVPEMGGTDREQIHISVGKADGKVQWGRVGLVWRRGMPREFPFNVSGLKTAEGRIEGRFTVPNRVISVAGDAKAACEFDLTAIRIQGLTGGRATFVSKLDGKPVGRTWKGYGRGGARRGGGKLNPDAPRPLWREQVDNTPWFVPVRGFKPVVPGEHPRLLFREADVAALRKKARTKEGKAIVARLRALLGGNGESLPTVFNPTPPHNHNKSPRLPLGAFTTWHGAGYGMLYQLTGEKKYADLGRQAVRLAFDGKVDRDNRYAWVKPGTHLRVGSILAGIALAYDLCYEAWPADFRKKVALELQNYDREVASGGNASLKYLAGRTGYPPTSNHYGAHVGAATAILAILGDPGTDTAVLTKRLAELETNLARILCHGFGDHGFYSEGHHPSRVSANCGLQELLLALRNAAGRDYITPRPNAQWLTLRWIMEIVPKDGRPHFPHRGPYGGDHFDGSGMSHSGEVAYGLGTIEAKYRPALLWVYEHFIKPDRPHYGANTYPHRAVAALVNWPVGLEPANPGTVMPKAVADTVHGYFVNRNRWKDENDILITTLLQTGHEGYHRVRSGGLVTIWGLGLRTSLRTGLGGHQPTVWRPAPDGSSVLSAVRDGQISSMAVDFSGTSGAPAMIVGVGPAFQKARHKPVGKTNGPNTRITELKAGGHTFVVFTLQEGKAPKPTVLRGTIRIGKQTIRFDGKRLRLGT